MSNKLCLFFSFVTWKPDAIILSSGPLVTRKSSSTSGSKDKSDQTVNLQDHLVIGLARGRVFAHLSTGTTKNDKVELKLNTKTQLNDGMWHKITLKFENRI